MGIILIIALMDVYLRRSDVVPPGGGVVGHFPNLQLVGRLVEQTEERTHGYNPGEVETAHPDADTHLEEQTNQQCAAIQDIQTTKAPSSPK